MSDLIIKAVIGANYGDEGKGLVTNYFCKQFADNNQKCAVICTNGGAQRGHTVMNTFWASPCFSSFWIRNIFWC